MKTIILILALCLFPVSNLFAAPGISDTKGDLIDKGQFTVFGNLFGSNPAIGTNDLQWLGENIEAGTSGDAFTKSGWSQLTMVDTGGHAVARYSTSQAHSGSKSIKMEFIVEEEINKWGSAIDYYHPSPMTKSYISFWIRTHDYGTCIGTAGGCQWKSWRITNGPNLDKGRPVFVQNTWSLQSNQSKLIEDDTDDEAFECASPCVSQRRSIPDDAISGPNAISDKWVRMEYYIEESSQGNTDGTFHYWIHIPGESIKHPIDYPGNLRTRTATQTNHFDHVWLGTSSGSTLDVWWDDVFIQVGTQARVEIGDAATWNACTHREIQIPTAWSNTSITVTVNLGSFQPKEPGGLYLYVVDAAGNVNQNGYLLEAPKPPIPSMTIQ